jgi:branched-subunit amino acid transport protein AzlD
MTIDIGASAATLVVVALVTWLTRALPHLLFGGQRELPATVSYLGAVLPAAIMIILVVYCLRGITLSAFPYGLAELISVGIVIIAQVLRQNIFLSIFLGTLCYMILIRTIFPL